MNCKWTDYLTKAGAAAAMGSMLFLYGCNDDNDGEDQPATQALTSKVDEWSNAQAQSRDFSSGNSAYQSASSSEHYSKVDEQSNSQAQARDFSNAPSERKTASVHYSKLDDTSNSRAQARNFNDSDESDGIPTHYTKVDETSNSAAQARDFAR